MLYNERSGNIEVAQRFDLHDAEHAVQQLFGINADILDSEQTQDEFYQYAVQNFAMFRTDNSQIELENIGYELEGKYFWAYQTATLEPDLRELQLVSSALHDLWSDQVNWVNIKRDGQLQTAVFQATDNHIFVSFDSDQ